MIMMFAITIHMTQAAVLVSMMVSSVLTFTLPLGEHLRIRNEVPMNNSNETDEIQNFNENQYESKFASSAELFTEDEEEIMRDWLFPEFLGKILPSSGSLFSSYQAEATNHSSPTSTPGILSKLFPNVIIERPSLFRVQFYNSDFEDSSTPDDSNSTGPNAVFGSPLCLGLCVPIQVFSENTSIHFLSDKQISLLPPSVTNPTLLNSGIPGSNTLLDPLNNLSTTTYMQTTEETSRWWSSWIPTAPSLSKIQSSIQLPQFGVADFIG